MTKAELQEYGSKMIELHPDKKDEIFIAVNDGFDFEDGDEMIQRLHDWIEDICNKQTQL